VKEWNSSVKNHLYIQKQWSKRESLIPGEKNVVNTPSTNPGNVYSPPLHIKLGLLKVTLQLDGSKWHWIYVFEKYVAKIKAEVFVGPQIR